VRKATEGGYMKTILKRELATLHALSLKAAGRFDGLDQPTMRWLSKVAKRKHVAVVDVIRREMGS
jgi:hypothetical protein